MPDTINPDDYTGAELKKLAQEEGVSTAGAKPAIAARIDAHRAEGEALPKPPVDAPVDTAKPDPEPDEQAEDDTTQMRLPTIPEPEVDEDTQPMPEEPPFGIQIGSDSTGQVSVISDHFQISEGTDRYRGLTLVSVGRRNAVGVAPLVFVREEFEEFLTVVEHVSKAREQG